MTLSADNIAVELGGHRILKQIGLTVRRGEMLALVGPNGSGKSTLLKTLSGEYRPVTGQVQLNGTELSTLDPKTVARHRSVVSQSAPVVFDFSVAEILEMGWLDDQYGDGNHYHSAMRQVVVENRIEHLLNRTFNTLSGGEQQRVQFARALLQVWQPPEQTETRFLLLDEPTANLDIAHEINLLSLSRQYVRRCAGALVVLHDLNMASRFCDTIALLSHGEIVAHGPVAEVLDEQLLSDVYSTPIQVEWHDKLHRHVIHS
ncbi:MAG: heme ABC transporter ATP-binding protein [Pseudomonadota bacterium]